MEVLLKSDHIASVPERWAEQYPANKYPESSDHRAKARALLALPPGFTAEQCDQIIGNKSWTRFQCDECKQDVDKLINLDDNPGDYESNHFQICIKCLGKAVKELNAT